MATIVNNPQPTNSSNGMGFLLGVILLIAFAVLFFIYGIPLLASYIPQAQHITIPSSIDIHVK